jgi:hypothetical protein
MATPMRRIAPDQLIFLGLASILFVLLVYFALTSIPAALRPTLSPTPVSTAVSSP